MADFARPHRSDPFLDQRWQEINNTSTSFYLRAEDEIRLSAWTTTAGLTITLNGILVTLHGDAVPFNLVLAPTSDGVRSNASAKLGPGTILYLYPTLSGGTPAVGNTTVSVEIQESTNATGPIVRQILFGSLTEKGFYRNEYVNTITQPNIGTMSLITQANPAAGANFTVTVPASTTWDFRSISFTLTNDATVADRTVNVLFKTGSVTLYNGLYDGPWPASNVGLFVIGNPATKHGADVPGLNGGTYDNCPPLILTAGCTITSSITNLQAGDQLSGIRVCAVAYTA